MKKLISILLVLFFSLSIIPFNCFAETNEIYNAKLTLLNYGDIPDRDMVISQSNTTVKSKARSLLINTAESDSTTDIMSYLYTAFMNHQTNIDIRSYSITGDELLKKISFIINNNPEMFFVKNSIMYYSSNNFVTRFTPTYTMTLDQYNIAYQEYNKYLNYIVDGISKDASDVAKILYAHDYLVKNYKYDTSTNTDNYIYDVYNFFVQKMGVCQAYTQAFNAIMKRMGISYDCVYWDNPTTGKAEHVWSIVKVGDKYYHVDCTQDDPKNFLDGWGRHYLFLLSGDTINEYKDHDNWYSCNQYTSANDPKTNTDKQYESGYIWNNYYGHFAYYNGSTYFIGFDGYNRNIYKSDDMKSSEFIYAIPDTNAYYFYQNLIDIFGDTLYFNNSNQILSYRIPNRTAKIEFSYNVQESNFIQSFYYNCTSYNEQPGHFTFTTCKNIEDKLYINDFSVTMMDANNDGVFSALDLALLRKYLIKEKIDCNPALLQVLDSKTIDIRTLIKAKKMLAEVA